MGRLFLIFFFLGYFQFQVFADMVYLTNKGQIEGIIERETEKAIVVNIGCGTMHIKKEEVERIDRYPYVLQERLERNWRKKYFSRPEYTPFKLKDLAAEFRKLERARTLAVEAKKDKDDSQGSLSVLEQKTDELKKRLIEVSEQVAAVKNPAENIELYNNLVTEMNNLNAQVRIHEYTIAESNDKIKRFEKQIFNYTNELALFRKKLMERFSGLKHEQIDNQMRLFFESAKEHLEKMENDFNREVVVYDQTGASIIVEVLLNHSVRGRFVLDTGAAMVLLSRDLAEKLNINLAEEKEEMQAILADGRTVKAKQVILRNVKLGDAEVNNVLAAVLEQAEPMPEDGLLGMSFLKHFTVKLNPKEHLLVLEQFNP